MPWRSRVPKASWPCSLEGSTWPRIWALRSRQIPSIHDAMEPTESELSWAHRVLAAADQADGGVSVVDGRMVDAPVVRAAQRTLARAGSPQPRSTSA